MAWALDVQNSVNKVGSGSSWAGNIIPTGVGTDNNQYWFICQTVIHVSEAADSGRIARITSLRVGDSAGTTGGFMTEILRYRHDTNVSAPVSRITQLFVARNSDFATPVDIESLANVKFSVVMNNAAFKTNTIHMAIMQSPNAPTAGDVIDYMEGGICERGDGETGATGITHLTPAAGDFVTASVASGDFADYSGWTIGADLFDKVNVVSAGTLDVRIRGALTTPADTTLTKNATGDLKSLIHLAVRFSESAIVKGPFLISLEANGNVSADCDPELFSFPGQTVALGLATEVDSALAMVPIPHNLVLYMTGDVRVLAALDGTVELKSALDGTVELKSALDGTVELQPEDS